MAKVGRHSCIGGPPAPSCCDSCVDMDTSGTEYYLLTPRAVVPPTWSPPSRAGIGHSQGEAARQEAVARRARMQEEDRARLCIFKDGAASSVGCSSGRRDVGAPGVGATQAVASPCRRRRAENRIEPIARRQPRDRRVPHTARARPSSTAPSRSVTPCRDHSTSSRSASLQSRSDSVAPRGTASTVRSRLRAAARGLPPIADGAAGA